MGAPENHLSNLTKVAYTTYYDTEKVVKTFTGSFKYSTSTTTRNYTLAGFPNAVQVYKLPHGFDRPVFCEMFWSLDQTNWDVGGASSSNGSDYAIAYSDSNFVYIMTTTLAAGTDVYFKIICSWIPDYDTTNPSVPAFAEIPASFTQVFNSRSRIPAVVQQDVLVGSTTSATLTDVTLIASHSLGYAPAAKAYIESFSGEVWPLNYGGAGNPYMVDDSQVEAQFFTTPTQFIGDMYTKSANGQRKLWYFLYGETNEFIDGVYSFAQLTI